MELKIKKIKLNFNGTTFYLHLNAIHGNQLDLLTLPKFHFWTEAGKLFLVAVTVLWNRVFFLPIQLILGQVVSHLFMQH